MDQKLAFLIIVGIGASVGVIFYNQPEKLPNETTDLSEGDRYDFNKSTTTVNRSSDIRDHRTMDSRPYTEYDAKGDRYDFNKSTTTVNRSSDIREHRTMDSRPIGEYP